MDEDVDSQVGLQCWQVTCACIAVHGISSFANDLQVVAAMQPLGLHIAGEHACYSCKLQVCPVCKRCSPTGQLQYCSSVLPCCQKHRSCTNAVACSAVLQQSTKVITYSVT